MLSWKDVMMAQEHRQDLLREAEEARLVKELNSDDEGKSVWQKVKGLFFGANEKKKAEGRPCVSSWDAA